LLRQPSLLLNLQEQVLMHGGDYWQTKLSAVSGGMGSKTIFDLPTSVTQSQTDSTAQMVAARKTTSGGGSSWSPQKIIATVAALAAAIFILASIPQIMGNGQSVAGGGWGFAKSGLLKSDISESEMLNQLAKASSSWHNKTPQTKEQLVKRLTEFDEGCQALLASSLAQLSASNRMAVHDACEDCRQAIAGELAALADGAGLAQSQSNANAAIDRLTESIKVLT
jgi:hypothetical protein